MVILNDVGRGIRVAMETHGARSRVVIECSNFHGDERALMARRVAAFVQMLFEILQHQRRLTGRDGH